MTTSPLRTRKTALALAVAVVLGVTPWQESLAVPCAFNPASGDWGTLGNWSCGAVPGAADTATVASGKTATVSGAQGATAISNAGTISINNNSGLGLLGTNVNDGLINLNSFGNNTDLTFSGAAALNGSGTVNMSNSSVNRILGVGATTLSIGAGQTIQGAGKIGAATAMALINNGTIVSTLSGLFINSAAGVTNNSVLRADGATLVLENTAFNQGAAGTLNALNGSVVQLSNSSITGGSFSTASGGAVATAGATFGNTLSGVTNTGTFNLVNNSGIVLGGTLTNNGSVNLISSGNVTDIALSGSRSILGSGVIALSNYANNRIYGTAGSTLTLGSGQTLTGAGVIGAGASNFALVNQGTIIASSNAGLLINASAGVTNTGTLRADGGTLSLQTTVNSGGGAIEARNGSQVQLLNGAVINNANFSASGAGSLITTVNGASVTMGGGTVSGPVTVANNSSVRLTGDLIYNGTLTLNSGGNVTDLVLDGARTIGGTATIQMSSFQNNRLYAANASGDALTLASGVTLQGAGQLGTNTALAIANNGTVIATSGTPLLVETSAGLTNNGVMRADGGTLQFGNVVVNSSGGSIEARNGSQVQLLNGSTINNANFSATGAGSVITTVNGATVTLGGGTVAGPMSVANNSVVRLTGDLVYNGTLSMNSTGNVADMIAVGARMISGAANISLSNYANNRIYTATAGDSLTFASGVTVQGAGQIGAGTATTLTNNGTWLANQSTGMVLSTTGAATNNNLIRADGANFSINQTSLGQGATGTLNAINGGSVILNNGTQITGGIFSTASGGQVVVGSGQTARFAGVNNTGALNISNNSTLILNGALTNNGVINFQSGGNVTDLRTDGNQSINGIGSINLSNYAANRIYGVAAGDSLTLGSGQTLQGAGSIGAGTQFNFTNNGTMLGNQSNALQFYSSGTVANNGLVRADGGNVLITGGTAFGQSGSGVLSAINGGVVTINANAAVTGGTLATTDTGQFTTQNGGTATIANLANTGTFNVVNNSVLRLQGTVTNAGTLNLKSGGNVTDLLISGAVTLVGNGTTTLSDYAANRIFADGAGAQLTVGAGQTLQGAGQLGVGTVLALLNQGTITANQSNALTVSMSGGVQNAASGLMQATAGGTLTLNSALSNSGTLSANGGVVNANQGFTGTGTALITGSGQLNVAAPSTVGTLTHNGTSANGLALGANSITVSSDYTNASSGSGNTFNRRANVTGAGQILAGGNAAQTITGSNVTNGNTANATLTIGNLRVGATTFNYQVGNVGSTGPTLRGAIQTNVNGGNLTDARLSGSGATASNYNAGAPGANTGNLAVTFTAAAAGALAPMAAQVLNLRSNFENIPDQKLNIVLGSGAAAFNAAVGSATPTPVTLADQRVGGTLTQALTVSNTAAAGAFSEDLNASFGTSTGSATHNAANIAGVVAGGSNVGSMSVGVNTLASGAKTGSVTLQYQTNGTVGGVSNGLGVAGANPDQVINVSGNVYQAASGSLQTGPLNFGTLQVGQTLNQNLVVRNTATGAAGFVEDLHASFGASGNSQITGSGLLNGILAGSNSTVANGTMTVTVTGATAGALNSGIAVNYTSTGKVGGVSNGLGMLAVGSEQFGVNGTINATGNVINQASPLLNTPSIDLGAVRVGAASPTANVSVSNQATTAPQAALNASISSNGAPVTASGSFNLLNPGQTNASSLQVGLNTAVAGNYTGANAGSATLTLVSDASNVGGCASNCQLNLASQNVSVSGKVYTQAVGQLNTPAVDFGIVRVGDTVSARNITVQNGAAATALNDTLRASLTGATGAFAPGAAAAGIAAQGSGQIGVGLNTAAAGVFNQNAAVVFTSQNADMADVSAGPNGAVQLRAQVNNLANADFDLLTGAGLLSNQGNGTYVLNLGNILQGSSGQWLLQLANDTSGPADLLRGDFDTSAVDDLALTGWGAVDGLAAGQSQDGLQLDFSAVALGGFQDTITFNGFGYNASDRDGLAQSRQLIIRANVIDANGGGNVPEPGTLGLLLIAVVGALRARAHRSLH